MQAKMTFAREAEINEDSSPINFDWFTQVQDLLLGSFMELDDTILEEGTEIDLFNGAIISTNHFSLLITTSYELYPRNPLVDNCAESPKHANQVNVGGGNIQKLIIGSKYFNIVVTGSIILHPPSSNAASIGPTCHPFIQNANLSKATLYVCIKKEGSPSGCTSSIENLRQITTSLNRLSAYTNLRVNLFEDRLMHPSTVFSLCSYPTDFGMSYSSRSRAVSRLFSKCAKAVLFADGDLSKEILETLMQHYQEAKLSLPLSDDLQKDMGKPEFQSLKALEYLSKVEGLSKVAQSLSGQLSTTNKKIAEHSHSEFEIMLT
ncbi:hypothetical protein MBANPS3_012487 [Mucor bainieri]